MGAGVESDIRKKQAKAVLKKFCQEGVKLVPVVGTAVGFGWDLWAAWVEAGRQEGLNAVQEAQVVALLDARESAEVVDEVLATPQARAATSKLLPLQQEELRQRFIQLPGDFRLQPPKTEVDVARVLSSERPRLFNAGDRAPQSYFTLENYLGQGGFAEVWEASIRGSRERRAIKFCVDPMERGALKQELETVIELHERLSHKNQAGFLRFFPAECRLDCDPPYLVAELCEGDLLKLIQPEKPRLAPEECLRLLLDPLRALSAAHAASPGVVHRDIKPANILWTTEGTRKKTRLADFGLARIVVERNIQSIVRSGQTGHSARMAGMGLAGTALYMAPEVQRGDAKPNDLEALKRADVYSAGVTLAQLLFHDPKMAGGEVDRDALDELPQGYGAFLDKCLKTKPERRFADAGELLGALEALIPPARAAVAAPPPASPPRSPSPPPPPAPAKPKERRPGELLTLDCGGVPLNMVWVPPGTFLMGSPKDEEGHYENEGPQTRVTLTQGFWMAETQTTQAQWKVIMGSNPSNFKGDNLPVEKVSWNDATEFCKKLSSRTGQRIGLPTEAQWEYACRAGTMTRFSYGDGDSRLGHYAWFSGNSNRQTHPVRQKQPNAWGLYDMHGNVGEWCADWFGAYPSGHITNFAGYKIGSFRVCRGGSWDNNSRNLRSAHRGWEAPTNACIRTNPSFAGVFGAADPRGSGQPRTNPFAEVFGHRDRDAPAGAYGSLGFRVALVPAG